MRKLLVAAAVVALVGASSAYAQPAPGEPIKVEVPGVGYCEGVGDPGAANGHICCSGVAENQAYHDYADGWIACGNDDLGGGGTGGCCANEAGDCGQEPCVDENGAVVECEDGDTPTQKACNDELLATIIAEQGGE